MKFYYVFNNGKIMMKNKGTSLPDSDLDSGIEPFFINNGFVDKGNPDGDVWAEWPSDIEIPEGFELHERRELWRACGTNEFFKAGRAFHIMDWQRRNIFCGICGGRTEYDDKELAMRCTECGELEFPEISPAIIVAVEKDGKLLMGHGVNFPPGRYSILAGFVEPGESLEECVKREVYEECKVCVKNIQYFGSQPWPFPRSLMIGFTAEWDSGEIEEDKTEITEAGWFAPDEMPEVFRGISISWKLIDNFLKRHS